MVLVLYPIVLAGALIAARYLRNQRELMELAANAEELKKAYQSLRQRADTRDVQRRPLFGGIVIPSNRVSGCTRRGALQNSVFPFLRDLGVVSVPASLLEQTSKIEAIHP